MFYTPHDVKFLFFSYNAKRVHYLFFDNELEKETYASLDGLKMSDESSIWGHHDIPTKKNVYQDSSDDDLESSSSEEVSLGVSLE